MFAELTANPKPIDVLSPDLAGAVLESIDQAIAAGAVVAGARDTEGQFQAVVSKAMTDLEPRTQLLKRFLDDGPYEGQEEEIPPDRVHGRLSDSETAAIRNRSARKSSFNTTFGYKMLLGRVPKTRS